MSKTINQARSEILSQIIQLQNKLALLDSLSDDGVEPNQVLVTKRKYRKRTKPTHFLKDKYSNCKSIASAVRMAVRGMQQPEFSVKQVCKEIFNYNGVKRISSINAPVYPAMAKDFVQLGYGMFERKEGY
jgi:hypothetical protein